MEFKAMVSEEVALKLMHTDWPESGLFVEIKEIEDTGRIKMELSDNNKTPTRTKIEYVKVTESIFYLKEEFEKGALYYRFCGSWHEIKTLRMLGHKVECGTCYRRIETPITEREEFIEKVGDILPVFDKRTNPMWAGKLYDAGCRFVGE